MANNRRGVLNTPSILEWKDVSQAADHAFSVWVGSPELRWAKQAWQLMIKSDLAVYFSELERHEVAIRFIALADIYLDFCKIGFEENCESDYELWAEDLDLSDLCLGILIGNSESSNGGGINDYSTFEAIQFLSYQYRKDIYPILTTGLGGQFGVFKSLWLSRVENEKFEEESDSFSLTFSGLQMNAYSWIQDGCDSIRF